MGGSIEHGEDMSMEKTICRREKIDERSRQHYRPQASGEYQFPLMASSNHNLLSVVVCFFLLSGSNGLLVSRLWEKRR
jgi:hypothetical protein